MIQPSKRLELLFLASLPALITFLLMIFYLASKHVDGLDHFMPLLPIIPVFYWGMTQTRDMPFWFVFGLGLVMDAVMGQPLGLTSLIFIFFLIMLHAQRKYFHKEGFVIKWGYFALLLAVTSIMNWVLLSFFITHSYPFVPAFLQWLMTLCCYPFMHKGFDGLHDYIYSRRWQIMHGQ